MMNGGKRKIELIEYVGLFLVAFSFLMLVVNPGGIGNLFNNMFNHAAPIIIKVYITGSIGIAIIISVTMGAPAGTPWLYRRPDAYFRAPDEGHRCQRRCRRTVRI